MTQKEFVELSKREVKSLNGHQEQDNVLDAWRGGYEFARKEIETLLKNEYHNEFLTKVEAFIEQDLEVFDFG